MNKFLITVIIPTIEKEYDVYIPNNKKMGTIKKYLLKAIFELSSNNFSKNSEEVRMIDRNTGIEYDNNMYVKDTEIKNGSKIIIM